MSSRLAISGQVGGKPWIELWPPPRILVNPSLGLLWLLDAKTMKPRLKITFVYLRHRRNGPMEQFECLRHTLFFQSERV